MKQAAIHQIGSTGNIMMPSITQITYTGTRAIAQTTEINNKFGSNKNHHDRTQYCEIRWENETVLCVCVRGLGFGCVPKKQLMWSIEHCFHSFCINFFQYSSISFFLVDTLRNVIFRSGEIIKVYLVCWATSNFSNAVILQHSTFNNIPI